MTTALIVLGVVIVVALLVAGGLALARRRRSARLRERFGPEYDRVLADSSGRGEAERTLREREQSRDELELRTLSDQERDRFSGQWTSIRRGFVDDPVRSTGQAEALTTEILRARGYSVDDPDRLEDEVSVDHPEVVEEFRAARRTGAASPRGGADTEDLRSTVASYGRLVESLLAAGTAVPSAEGTSADGRSAEGRHAGRGDGTGAGRSTPGPAASTGAAHRDAATDPATDPATDGRHDGSRA